MKIAILGFGKEGESAFRYWSRQSNDITIHDNDLNKDVPEGVETVLGNEALQNLDDYGYDLMVRSPGGFEYSNYYPHRGIYAALPSTNNRSNGYQG